MMKFRCECGHIIYDQTDNLPNKAHIISDEDWGTILDAEASAVVDQLSEIDKLAYQCTKCGRLYFNGPERTMHIFKLEYASPEDEAGAKTLFKSTKTRKLGLAKEG